MSFLYANGNEITPWALAKSHCARALAEMEARCGHGLKQHAGLRARLWSRRRVPLHLRAGLKQHAKVSGPSKPRVFLTIDQLDAGVARWDTRGDRSCCSAVPVLEREPHHAVGFGATPRALAVWRRDWRFLLSNRNQNHAVGFVATPRALAVWRRDGSRTLTLTRFPSHSSFARLLRSRR